ncbi:histone-fold-containing protein [Endogone sp. FLAS-F59071]|nr:histone-fold-containing protein [Endogone sp. FLAS-F59071]|eukprot:RUS18762.1 histone-fold-containing protein [Endogone sp. FLAS-F59071]
MSDQNLHHHSLLDQPSAAAVAVAQAAAAQQAQPPTAAQMHAHQQLQQQQIQLLTNFWQSTLTEIEGGVFDFKVHQLPLARIKKVMKADEDVKAPILFAKGCDIFITELTMRAWIHAEENKRRTLQRSDIATAITKTDMFDFLIDIVPREEVPRLPAVKAEKIEGQEMDYPRIAGVDQHGYAYGYAMPQGQYAAAPLPADQRISMDSMLAYQQQQALQQQQMQYMRQQMIQQELIQHQQPGGPASQPGATAAAATQYYQYAQAQSQPGQPGAPGAAQAGAGQRAQQQYQYPGGEQQGATH